MDLFASCTGQRMGEFVLIASVSFLSFRAQQRERVKLFLLLSSSSWQKVCSLKLHTDSGVETQEIIEQTLSRTTYNLKCTKECIPHGKISEVLLQIYVFWIEKL